MCTLIVLHRCVRGAPLVAAANRDEFLDRPWQAPTLRPVRGRRVVAPLDGRAGGTWLGINEHGLFVGVLNRPSEAPDASRRSRGLLVLDLLGAATAREAAAGLERLPPGAYNPFNLFVGDGADAFAAVYEERPSVCALGPGPHVLGNADPDARDAPKTARQLEEAELALRGGPEGILSELAAICRSHASSGDDPRRSTCVHAGAYGTSSSTLLRLARDAGESALHFAAGPPCASEYEDFTHLLRELGIPARHATGETAMRNAI